MWADGVVLACSMMEWVLFSVLLCVSVVIVNSKSAVCHCAVSVVRKFPPPKSLKWHFNKMYSTNASVANQRAASFSSPIREHFHSSKYCRQSESSSHPQHHCDQSENSSLSITVTNQSAVPTPSITVNNQRGVPTPNITVTKWRSVCPGP